MGEGELKMKFLQKGYFIEDYEYKDFVEILDEAKKEWNGLCEKAATKHLLLSDLKNEWFEKWFGE